MSNFFNEILNGNIPDVKDINETSDIDTEGEVFTEAVFADKIPYMKVFPRIFNLPKGDPFGKGIICFLYSRNVEDSINKMSNPINAIPGNRFYFYYINNIYKGKIYARMYRRRITEKRKEIYKKIQNDVPYVHPYRPLAINKNELRNIFIDLSEYVNIFFTTMRKVSPKKYVENYWTFFKSVLKSYDYLDNYHTKMMLININEFKFEKNIVKNLYNPMYMFYYTLFRYPNLLSDMDIDFYFYSDRKVLKYNPAKNGTGKEVYQQYKILMKRIASTANFEIDDKEVIKDEVTENAIEKYADIVDPPVRNQFTFIPDNAGNDNSIKERIVQKVDNVRKEVDVVLAGINEDESEEVNPEDLKELIDTKVENEINADRELIKDIYNQTSRQIVPTAPVLSARDKMLKEKQKDIVIKGTTIADIQKVKAEHVPIPEKDVSSSVHTTNKNMTHLKFQNFEKAYNENVMPQDIVNAILSLNNKSIPLFVRDIKVEDTSDELNYKETYTILLEDVNRQRHTVKVDIPKFLEDKFLYIGGNKKIIKKQSILLPVTKTDADTVQIVTNYNKMFIRRVDTKSVSSVERFKKVLKDSDDLKRFFVFGSTITTNVDYVTTIEYDELSKIFITFKTDNCTIFFSQKEAEEYREEHRIQNIANAMFIGEENGKPIYINTDDQLSLVGHKTIVDIILSHLPDAIIKKYAGTHAPKRLMYTKVKVMDQDMPVIMLICFWEGFSEVLKKADVKYTVSETQPKTLGTNENVLRFKNCWITYEETVGQSLLLNGLRIIDTTQYDLSEMDTMEPYVRYFEKIFGKATIGNALQNFYEFSIDPITLEILKDINLPTDIVSLMIYAVNLLQDSQFVPEINQGLSRIRSNEIVPAILYEALAKNYINYKNSNGKKKFAIPQDIVIKNLIGLKTVEDYSTLNPVLEMEMTHGVSNKGFRGVNLDEAYTMKKRAYDSSMTGIIAPSSSPDGSVGVNKVLTMEPSITSVRGYVDIKSDRLDELKDVNLFSPGELSIPLGATRDDPTRLGHANKQSKHVIPVKDSSPVLMSNGFEEVCRFKLSSDFVVNADEDGEVIEKDEKRQIMIVKYKSGKYKAVNIGKSIVKNGGGGFFLSNQLESPLNVGDKFKKNDCLAYHKNFFTSDKFNDTRMNMGTLAKVALMSTYQTFQDATFISQRLADAAATEICFMKQAVIGKNSNVTFMIEEGRNINVGDPLIQFDTSYNDNELNELLAAIGNDQVKDKIMEEAKNTIKSKYSGVVESIEIYATVPLEEMSPSLRAICSKYYKKISSRNALLEKYDPESKNSVVKCGILCKEPNHQIEANKYGVIKGQNVEDSILINFYIKHMEPLEIGSKIANFTALKNTIGEIVPEGYEPYSSFRPDEVVDTMIASNAILKRMTPSITLTVLGNKCVIELKNRLKEIYDK